MGIYTKEAMGIADQFPSLSADQRRALMAAIDRLVEDKVTAAADIVRAEERFGNGRFGTALEIMKLS